MKTALTILLLPCFLFSQIKKTDTANLPPPVQEVVKNIIIQKHEQQHIIEKINAELDKQMKILQQMKMKMSALRNAKKANPADSAKVQKILAGIEGLKPEEYDSILNNPEVKWEQRPKSWFGRLFSKKKYRQFPYIIDEDSIIYIKRK